MATVQPWYAIARLNIGLRQRTLDCYDTSADELPGIKSSDLSTVMTHQPHAADELQGDRSHSIHCDHTSATWFQ